MSLASSPGLPMTAAQIKQKLRHEGTTLKAWAELRGYAYGTVSAVMSGKIKVVRNYGVGFEIARELGLILELADGSVVHAERRHYLPRNGSSLK